MTGTCQKVFRVLVFPALVSAAFAAEPAHPVAESVDGEVLVTFKKNADLPTAQRALSVRSLALGHHFDWLSKHQRQHIGLVRSKTKTTAELIADLQNDPTVETVEPNYKRWVCASPPNDKQFGNLWGLQNTGQNVLGTVGTPGSDIHFINAWSMARSPTGRVIAAVIDTGVDFTHPDLVGNLNTNPGEIPYNGLDDDGNGYVDDYYGFNFVDGNGDAMDSGEHGTHVCGTIAAIGNNGLGVIGVAYKANVMALKVSTNGSSISTSAEILALQYAALMKSRGMNIVAINASYGGGSYSSAERAAIKAAGDVGIIFCAAAGNGDAHGRPVDNDKTPFYPASYRLTNMIVVAAVGQNDTLATFSNYGATSVDLAAPGVNILSAMPVLLGTSPYVQSGASNYAANLMTYSVVTPVAVTGLTAAVYDCGLGGDPTNFPPEVRSNIALIARGTYAFSAKVSNAMTAGARGVIIYNNAAGNYSGTLASPSNWVPTVSIAQADGVALRAALPTNATIVAPDTYYQYMDGTSMATPHVAGAVAFAAMNFPIENVTQRVNRVLANVDVVAGLSGKVQTGGRLNLTRIVDTTSNGLPDWWETLYFGGTTNPAADSDHDGESNLAEFLAGTNPTNALSCLELVSISTPVAGVSLSWASVTGKLYSVQSGASPTGAWNIIATNLPATPPVNTFNGNASATNEAFFRILLGQ